MNQEVSKNYEGKVKEFGRVNLHLEDSTMQEFKCLVHYSDFADDDTKVEDDFEFSELDIEYYDILITVRKVGDVYHNKIDCHNLPQYTKIDSLLRCTNIEYGHCILTYDIMFNTTTNIFKNGNRVSITAYGIIDEGPNYRTEKYNWCYMTVNDCETSVSSLLYKWVFSDSVYDDQEIRETKIFGLLPKVAFLSSQDAAQFIFDNNLQLDINEAVKQLTKKSDLDSIDGTRILAVPVEDKYEIAPVECNDYGMVMHFVIPKKSTNELTYPFAFNSLQDAYEYLHDHYLNNRRPSTIVKRSVRSFGARIMEFGSQTSLFTIKVCTRYDFSFDNYIDWFDKLSAKAINPKFKGYKTGKVDYQDCCIVTRSDGSLIMNSSVFDEDTSTKVAVFANCNDVELYCEKVGIGDYTIYPYVGDEEPDVVITME